ncbi:MAG: ergothioneine biosynthesis protein EgtB [Leptospira sp.]|nr:ergothioneine biosynthesis protein EgtB [Leptospira sp.]
MDLKESYTNVRFRSLKIMECLEIEDYVPQAIDFVSPPKWNLGHTTWFFEEFILSQFKPGYKKFHPVYDYLFNSYYNEKGDRVARTNRGALSRPTVKEVIAYRKAIDSVMQEFISEDIPNECKQLIILGIHHEQQHQELFFTDLKYTWSLNPLYPGYSEIAFVEDIEVQKIDWINVDEGIYTIGHQGEGFCFDNELGSHKVFLQDFSIRDNLVTNAEFIEFILDYGYKNYIFWHEEGWAWINQNQMEMPMYWIVQDNEYFQYTLAGLKKINPNHILTHISYYEAYAFAEWKNCKLPTEFEWEVASDRLSWGDRWEWTSSSYLPYPGFTKNMAAGEYNGKFMVNQQVLRGSSVVTPAGHSRKTYRNFFHPQIGYQFNGIRLVKK